MARKVEPALVEINRNRIVSVAKDLFYTKSIALCTMDDVAKAAGMSRSTLYVYFKNKEEIVNYISLEAMHYLYDSLERQIGPGLGSLKEQYMKICNTLLELKEKYPLNYQVAIGEIPVDSESLSKDWMLQEIYDTGEKIKQLIIDALVSYGHTASKTGFYKNIFILWGSINGLITLAENKQHYIEKSMKMTKEEFIQEGFEKLFKAIN